MMLAVLVFVIVSVFGFLSFYNSYIDKTLYAERLSQMREVTTQLFSGLEDVVNNQWRTTAEQCRALEQEQPDDMDSFLAFMKKQMYLCDFETAQCNIVAVDSDGVYYSQNGLQGLIGERDYLLSSPDRVSYVSNSLISDETRMVFMQRLDTPVIVKNGDNEIKLIYYGIAQNMEELNPYFECSAYNGNNSVYVVDSDGLRLFSTRDGNALLKGFNIYKILDGMDYLHGSNFDSAKEELESSGISYSNAVINDTEVYYALYNMENAEWTLIFLVPSKYVAINTVELVNMTIRLVLVFAVLLVIVSASAIFWLLKRQQKAALEVERRNNEALEHVNRELEDAVKAAEQASYEAAEASKAKSDFLSNMSHDIRTPMNAIVGITNLMEHEEGNSEKLHTYIHKVQLSSRHLLSLINDILDMSKIESSEVALNQDSVSLAEQIGQVDSIIRPQTTERGQTFSIIVNRIAHEYLVGDGVRLRQILLNLLSNAVKYTPDGGDIKFEIAELPCDTVNNATFRITVEDNGYGMTPEFTKHIFEPFTRAENSVTNKVQGTGLGMAITKNIVDLMGGTISVDSQLNKGSRFDVVLTLPVDCSVQQERKPDLHSIMLISDDTVLINNIKASLSEANVELAAASDQFEAEAMLAEAEDPADVILINGYLDDPQLSGNIHRLREAAKNNVLIFCCDSIQADHADDILPETGADGIISRPFFCSNLIHAIERARGDAETEKLHNASVLNGMRFLCAEDNELNAEILDAILEMNGASGVIYHNGKELVDAFDNVRPGKYDAILMDVQMPVMNGLEATRAIRSSKNPLGKTMPIIAMTANAFTEDIQDCLNAGMDAHVAKPLDIAVLERTLRGIKDERFSGGGKPQIRNRKKKKAIIDK